MRFADIPGLEDTKRQLIHAIESNHVAHAQLFYGKVGSANLAMALAYATYINCLDPSSEDACGKCTSCSKMDKFIHPDLQFVYPVSSTKSVAAKNAVSSSFSKEWRTFLNSKIYGGIDDWAYTYGAENKQVNISKEESRNIIKGLSLKSFEAKYKVLVIWLPEYMHVSAANGILKILEEPPEKTLFMLVSCDYEKLLTTILSRCQLFKVPAFSDEDVSQYLIDQHQMNEKNAFKIASLSEGSLKVAIDNIDSTEDDSHVIFRDWMRYCWTRNFTALNQSMDKFATYNKSDQKLFFQYAISMMRQSIMFDYLSNEKVRLNDDEQSFVSKFASALGLGQLEMISNHFNTALYHLERNANQKILFMDLSLTISKIMRSK